MKALVITEPGTAIFIEKEIPSPAQGEVLLRICNVGYCGTDLNTFRGLNPLVRYPRIPCHELSAIIEKKGVDVPDEFPAGHGGDALRLTPAVVFAPPAARAGSTAAATIKRWVLSAMAA